MKQLIHFFFFIAFISLFASCSSSRQSVSYRKSKKETVKKRLPAKDYAGFQLRDEVIIHAIQHVGRNYKYGGKKPRTGFDCSGLVSYAFGKAGIKIKGASHQQAKSGMWKSRSELQPGDLIFFGKGKKISHVAIVIKNDRDRLEVIHSTSSRGVVIDDISDSKYWNNRYLFGRDIIGQTEDMASLR